jgi:hypothetical protein
VTVSIRRWAAVVAVLVLGFLQFVAKNPNLSVFALGFFAFSSAMAAYSWQMAGVCAGVILMVVAAAPALMTRKP